MPIYNTPLLQGIPFLVDATVWNRDVVTNILALKEISDYREHRIEIRNNTVNTLTDNAWNTVEIDSYGESGGVATYMNAFNPTTMVFNLDNGTYSVHGHVMARGQRTWYASARIMNLDSGLAVLGSVALHGNGGDSGDYESGNCYFDGEITIDEAGGDADLQFEIFSDANSNQYNGYDYSPASLPTSTMYPMIVTLKRLRD
jgi:hypothetical protein